MKQQFHCSIPSTAGSSANPKLVMVLLVSAFLLLGLDVTSAATISSWQDDSAGSTENQPDAEMSENDAAPAEDAQQEPASEATAVVESVADWAAMAEVLLPESPTGASPLYEFTLTPAVFTRARADLLDLRLFTPDEKPVPYSLRILSPKDVREAIPAEQFNESVAADGTRELSLDLGSTEFQHNEILIETTGHQYRRRVQLEGSDDGMNWRRLVQGFVMSFEHSSDTASDEASSVPSKTTSSLDYRKSSIKYADSRLRYLRVQVFPDLEAGSAASGKDEFTISNLDILHTVQVPGEFTTQELQIGKRQPTRGFGVPASRWILELGGENVPVSELEIEVEDHEFARDILLEAEYPSYPPGTRQFQMVSPEVGYTWQRRPGDPRDPIVVRFSEVQTRRLRLTVTDYQNAPLTIKLIRAKAAARKLIFPAPSADSKLVKLYFGRVEVEPARYDFDRNLPAQPNPAPTVATLMEAQDNPAFIPPPQPLSERMPWLVYLVLAAVTAVLGLIIVSMARYAINAQGHPPERDGLVRDA